MQRIILHIDFDSFFASCEQQFNPAFRGKPLAVTATHGRTCIIAASREAKKLGVKSPSRLWEMQQLVPDLIPVPAHFEDYWEISKKFIAIAKDYSPFVEVFSLDEVFMDITRTAHLYGGVYPLIEQIRKRLRQEIGLYITVSVGIAHNKLLAKLASGMNKPDGMKYIAPTKIVETYSQCDLTDICGIGPRIEARLNLMGVSTLLQLRNTSISHLKKEFGTVEGEFLYQVGQGIDTRPVIPYYDPVEVKSVSRDYCLPQNEENVTVVVQNMYELCEEIGIKLRRIGKSARTVGISLRGSQNIFFRKTYHTYMNTGKEIFHTLMILLNGTQSSCDEYTLHWMKKKDYVRQISVWVSNLEDHTHTPLSLFEYNRKQEKLAITIDSINEKFGNHTIRNAFLLYADKLTTKPNGFMADKFERMQIRGL
ncbi:MAG TPA: DNA polymerase IV [Candidatus Levybacteria bacterium]|nr:DNA polymerase IV [Candidatus Levybacteria bacterium]